MPKCLETTVLAMKRTILLCVTAAGVLGAGCKKDEPKTDEAPAKKAETGQGQTEAPGQEGKPVSAGLTMLFAGDKPATASTFMPEIKLGMPLEEAKAIWEKNKKAFQTEDFKLTFIASDEKTIDMLQYVQLPKDGVIEIGEKTWGKAALDPAADDPEYPRKRSCWFNAEEGVRACALYDETMEWTNLTIDEYLAAESMIEDGLFVFERGKSLLGLDYEGLKGQLVRFDDWPHRKNSFIPPTDFGEINKLDFEFAEDGTVTSMEFSLHFFDDAHRERLLKGLESGLGEPTAADDTYTFTAAGRQVVAEAREDGRFAVKISKA